MTADENDIARFQRIALPVYGIAAAAASKHQQFAEFVVVVVYICAFSIF